MFTEIIDLIKSDDADDRRNGLDYANVLLESYLLNQQDAVCLAQALIGQYSRENTLDTQEDILSALLRISMSFDLKNVDLSVIVSSLPRLDMGLLQFSLAILGLSHQEELRGEIEQYLNHPSLLIREAATVALIELGGRKEGDKSAPSKSSSNAPKS